MFSIELGPWGAGGSISHDSPLAQIVRENAWSDGGGGRGTTSPTADVGKRPEESKTRKKTESECECEHIPFWKVGQEASVINFFYRRHKPKGLQISDELLTSRMATASQKWLKQNHFSIEHSDISREIQIWPELPVTQRRQN